MLYGDEKAFEMSRSILPCTRRKGARNNKAIIARRLRRGIKHALRNIKCEDDYYDDYHTLKIDLYDDAAIDRSQMVGNRRGRDKLGPFMRWAEARAKDIPDGEKYDYIKSILPGGGFIIQDHAMGHCEWMEGFERNPLEFGWRYRSRKDLEKKVTDEEMIQYLREIIEDNKAHKALNHLMKRTNRSVSWDYRFIGKDPIAPYEDKIFSRTLYHKSKPRVLRGIHDIDHFMKDIKAACSATSICFKGGEVTLSNKYKKLTGHDKVYWGTSIFSKKVRLTNPAYHPEWRKALSKFIRVWRESEFPDYAKLNKVRVKIVDRRYAYRHSYSGGLIW